MKRQLKEIANFLRFVYNTYNVSRNIQVPEVETLRKLSPKAKTVLIYILSFLLPALMMMAIYASIGITYGGKVTVLTFDLKAQYAPFIAGLRYLLKDPGKILFNWNASMGGNYMGVFSYYLASPLNLITLFWKVEDIADAMYVLIILKIALCGLTFNTFLHKRHLERGISFYNLIFSICYALMSYNIAYGMCVMWLDAIILLPIVLLGIERILAGKKGGLFFISMTLTFITNYYMSYMVGVFVFLYFMCGVLSRIDKTNVKYYFNCGLRFAINTLLGLGIAMPLVLPSILDLRNRYSYGVETAINKDLAYSFRPLQVFKKFLPSQYDSLYSEFGNPYIFCGSIILILAILYFFQKRNVKEKLLPFLVLSFIFSGFLCEKIDYFWHGMRYPTGFPYRYAYLFSTLILLLAYESLYNILNRTKSLSFIPFIFCIYTILEIYMNGNAIQTGIHEEINYDIREEIQIQHSLYAPVAKKIQNSEEMYRMHEEARYYGYNIESAYGLNGMDFYASNINSNTLDFLLNIGSASSNLCISGTGFTPLADSLMGVDYIFAANDPLDMYQEVYSNSVHERVLKIYKNPNSLGIGFISKKDKIITPEWNQNPFNNQQTLLSSLGVISENIYQTIPYEVSIKQSENSVCLTFEFDYYDDKPILYHLNSLYYDNSYTFFYLNNQPILGITRDYEGAVFKMPPLKQGKNTLRIEGPLYGNIRLDLVSFNKDAYLSAIKQLSSNKLENVCSKGNITTATIDAGDGGTLFTTIPYDDGFSIFIDGKKTTYNKALDTFISLELPSGTHKIEFIYTPPGLILGIIIMCISFIISIVFYNRKYKKR